MKITGLRDGTRVMVGARVSESLVVPLAEVEEFWQEPSLWNGAVVDVANGVDLHAVEVVPPVRPSARVFCVGLNYRAHAEEGIGTVPEFPTIFGRWTSSLAANGARVAVPPDEPGLDWEGELAVLIGSALWQADKGEAAASIFGYAPFNDLTARGAQKLTTQWTLGKNVDNSGSLGEIVTVDSVPDVSNGLAIVTTVNGEVVQTARTSEMIFGIEELLCFISRTIALRPGDVLTTGTPSGVGYVREPPWLLTPGDVVQVDVEHIGSVSTYVDGATTRQMPLAQ